MVATCHHDVTWLSTLLQALVACSVLSKNISVQQQLMHESLHVDSAPQLQGESCITGRASINSLHDRP
jgi:hypothetical protein